MARRLFARRRPWPFRPSLDQEVDEELAFHLEMRARELAGAGLDPAAARREAERRFGDLARVREACRSLGRRRDRRIELMESLDGLRQDLRFALRQLSGNPGFAIVAVLTLALGIGLTSAIFGAVHAVVLRPLPYPEPERLVLASQVFPIGRGATDAGSLAAWRARSTSFAALGAIVWQGFNLAEGDRPERVQGAAVTPGYFELWGLAPALGRTLLSEEDVPGRAQVVVLSHRLWRRLGADPDLVGRDLRLNGTAYRVAGVMPTAFDVTRDGEELWVPLALPPERREDFDSHYLTVYGRLKTGVSIEKADAELASIAASLAAEHPRDLKNVSATVEPILRSFLGASRERLLILLGAVGFVLAIACANVANLLLARGRTRGREMALRAALGAGRGRVIRQLLTESAALACAGTALGLALAHWTLEALIAWGPANVPRLEQARLDGTVLAFATALALASTFLSGLAPALEAARCDLRGELTHGGRGGAAGGRLWGGDRLRRGLIAAEVGLAVLLLIGAGLLIRTGIAMAGVDLGFNPAGVLTARVMLPEQQYADAKLQGAFGRLLEAAAAEPGIEIAALTSQAPLGPGTSGNGLLPEGRPVEPGSLVFSRLRLTSPGYHAAMGIPLLAGRPFDVGDRAGAAKVMIVSESLARQAFPGESALGRRIACCEGGPDNPSWKEVVGIADDVRWRSLTAAPEPEFYLPVEQAPPEAWGWVGRTMYLVARTPGDPQVLAPALRRAVAAVDPSLPLFDVSAMEERIDRSAATVRFNTFLLSGLGLVGLALAAIGLYGVVSGYVAERRDEIGVRMALGSTPRGVVALVVRRAAGPVVAGLAAGLAAAWALTRLLGSQLFGVEPTDPVAFTGAGAVLLAAALAASWLPSRRAARVDPTATLREGAA
jgi:predicted permease